MSIYNSADDQSIAASLAESTNKEEIVLTDSDIDLDKEVELYFKKECKPKIEKRKHKSRSKSKSNSSLKSSYIHLKTTSHLSNFNRSDFLKEIFVIMASHLYLGISEPMFNVMTIDGILSCMIFLIDNTYLINYIKFLSKPRLMTIDRYIYYVVLFGGVLISNYLTWYNCPELIRYLASVMICPSIMNFIYNMSSYSTIRQTMYDGYNKLINVVICKQISKVINLFISNVLKVRSSVEYLDLIVYKNNFDYAYIHRLLVTFIATLIFNHLDNSSFRIPLMLYKNLYMKDTEYDIKRDKIYFAKIISNKRWDKFLDIYTLNRMIRMLADDGDSSNLSVILNRFMINLGFRINRIMFCWTLMGATNSTIVGLIGFLPFIRSTDNVHRYIINVMMFGLISYLTYEKLLLFVLCELCFTLSNSNAYVEILKDVYYSIKTGLYNLAQLTRPESIIFCIMMSVLSLIDVNSLYILGGVNLAIGFRIIKRIFYDGAKEYGSNSIAESEFTDLDASLSLSVLKNYLSIIRPSVSNPKTVQITSNVDLAKHIYYSVRNSALIRTIVEPNTVSLYDMCRLALYYVFIMMFGYISSFDIRHMMLPIIVQIITDMIL